MMTHTPDESAAPTPERTASPTTSTEAAADSRNDLDCSGCRLLIVDDNAQNVELLEAYLEGLPCEISSVSDGLEAIATVERDPPDLILLDVMMPRMSGFEVCQKLKTDPSTRDIPILMVTALNEVGDIERGVESGTDDFLSKPFTKLELITRVKSLLRMRMLKKQLDEATAAQQTNKQRHKALDERTSPNG